MKKVKGTTLIAIAFSLSAIILSHLVATRIFENIPHIEDEMAYVWQAKVIARGKIMLPSPPVAKEFLVPFVVDYHGYRFGKYPPGWPAVLAIGVLLHARDWVNPMLAGMALWLLFRLGKRLFGEIVALLACFLTLTSPFFFMNSASLLSHPLGLFLTLVFVLSWMDAWQTFPPETPHPNSIPRWIPILTAALSLGLLALTRPLTAIGIALPFLFQGAYIFYKGDKKLRLELIFFILIAGGVSAMLFLWQYMVTGDPLLNPYTLWWSYDKIGFGPGFGRSEGGHTLHMAWVNLKFSLSRGKYDLFGWFNYSYSLIPFGVLAVIWKRNWRSIPALLILPSLIFVYLFYWIGSSLFGPRYYYEGLFAASFLTALGFAFLAGFPITPQEKYLSHSGWRKGRRLILTALLELIVSLNLFFYLPMRLNSMVNLYGVNAQRLKPFQTDQALALTPALVIVHPQIWTEYGSLLDLSSPFLDSPWIFVRSLGTTSDQQVAEAFPQRNIIEYYPSDPYRLTVTRRAR
ncbi:MAG: hypothetical protein ACPL3P_00035 [Anaerolineales bacterium]